MSIHRSETLELNGPPSSGQTAGNVGFLPIGQLRTRYSCLRPGAIPHLPNDTAELPIRVVPVDDGMYEVVDGFKRFETWRELGQERIPVVVERPGRTEEHKRLLLEANSPKRTLTALDEARVVHSLMNEEGLTPNRIVRLFERKPQWVARRMDIATHLSPTAEDKLARGTIGPTLAHALCALPGKEQDAVLSSVDKHGLKVREALTLVSTYRVADETDRRELLKAPLGWVLAEPTPTPTTSPDTTELEKRLEQIREALVSLANFVIPPELAPPEQRRLDARLQSVLGQLQQTACAHGIEHEGPNLKGDTASQAVWAFGERAWSERSRKRSSKCWSQVRSKPRSRRGGRRWTRGTSILRQWSWNSSKRATRRSGASASMTPPIPRIAR